MEANAQYQRHDLVWLSDRAWQTLVFAHPILARPMPEIFTRWQAEEWPAVVTRHHVDTSDDEICIGFPLPPADGVKQRFSARVNITDVTVHQPAMSLHSVIACAPLSWQAALRGLYQQALAAGIKLRVYGSLAMQFLTGLEYLNKASDIDILFRPYHHAQLRAGLALLQQYQQQLPLDGEIIFPHEAAVAWKEWGQSSSETTDYMQQRVMVKDMRSASLRTRIQLLQDLPEGPLPC